MALYLINYKSILVQVMAWCRQAPSHYLSQRWYRSLSPYGVARPYWVIKITVGLTLCNWQAYHSCAMGYCYFNIWWVCWYPLISYTIPAGFICLVLMSLRWSLSNWRQCFDKKFIQFTRCIFCIRLSWLEIKQREVWGFPLTGEYPAQKASNAENASIWWRYHVMDLQNRRSSPILSVKQANASSVGFSGHEVLAK